MKRLWKLSKYILLLFGGIFLLWLAFRNQDSSEIIRGFKEAQYIFVLFAIGAAVLSTLSRAMRWRMLIQSSGHEVSLFNSFIALLTGYISNLAVPRMGEVTRCIALQKSDNLPFNKVFASVVIERAVDLLATLLLLILVLFIEFDRLKNFVSQHIYNSNENMVESVSENWSAGHNWVALAVFLSLFFAAYFLFKKRNSQFIHKVRAQIKGFIDGLKGIRNLKNYPLFIFHSIFIWVMYVFMTYLCFFAIEATSELNFSAAMFVMAVGSIGFIAPVQGGIGTYHWLVQESLVLYNVSGSDGLVFATIAHAAQTVFVLVLGSLSLVVLFMKFGHKIKATDVFKADSKKDIPG